MFPTFLLESVFLTFKLRIIRSRRLKFRKNTGWVFQDLPIRVDKTHSIRQQMKWKRFRKEFSNYFRPDNWFCRNGIENDDFSFEYEVIIPGYIGFHFISNPFASGLSWFRRNWGTIENKIRVKMQKFITVATIIGPFHVHNIWKYIIWNIHVMIRLGSRRWNRKFREKAFLKFESRTSVTFKS